MSQYGRSMSIESEKRIAGLYDLESTIGKGHFAVVKLARHVFTGERVAVKVIDKTKLDSKSKECLFQEVMCMKLVQHPHVVRLYEVIDTSKKLYLILELGEGGDLYDYIMKHERGIGENDAKLYFRQIVSAIMYCHQLHVVHRDLKPENVIFFEKLGIVKVTDFGFSNCYIPGKPLETFCGSLAYSAPEILLGDAYDPQKIDIWSLGVILYMLVCGELPFNEANDSETLTRIMDCKFKVPPNLSAECKLLIKKLLIRDPNMRASLEDILKDEWLDDQEDSFIGLGTHPLVSHKSISGDDHLDILNKMVDGNLASKQEIEDALSNDTYNYISATYFLLAERKLKRTYMHPPLKKQQQVSPSKEENVHLDLSNKDAFNYSNSSLSTNSVRVLDPPSDSAPEEKLRRFSMILEDEEDQDELFASSLSLASIQQDLDETGNRLGAPTVSRCGSRASSGHSDCESDSSLRSSSHSLRHKVKHQRGLRRALSSKPLSVNSQILLNNIREEDSPSYFENAVESRSTLAAMDIDSISKRDSYSLRKLDNQSPLSPTSLRRYRRASTGSKPLLMSIHLKYNTSVHSQQKSSRSSSENSDNDEGHPPGSCRPYLYAAKRQDSDHSSDGSGSREHSILYKYFSTHDNSLKSMEKNDDNSSSSKSTFQSQTNNSKFLDFIPDIRISEDSSIGKAKSRSVKDIFSKNASEHYDKDFTGSFNRNFHKRSRSYMSGSNYSLTPLTTTTY